MNHPDPLRRLRPGMRAVVRHRIPGGLTDALGTIEALDGEAVTVRTRRGVSVIRLADVVLAKEVPPPPSRPAAPHRAISVSDLEAVMVEGMPPLERERLGDWVLRAGGGYTGRANSLLPLGEPGVPLAEAVARFERWYAVRGLRRLAALFGPVGFAAGDDPLGVELLRRGYTEFNRTAVLTGPTTPSHAGGVTVVVEAEPSQRWWEGGSGREAESTTTRAAAESILTGSPEQAFLRAELDGETIGVARVAFAHVWAGVANLFVSPRHRRQGVAGALMEEATAQARARGIRATYLQVTRSNVAALALYARLGFEEHHEYCYLGAPTGHP